SEVENTPHLGLFIAYNNNVDNNIKGMVFPRYTNDPTFSELTFTLNGIYSSQNYAFSESESDLIRTNDNSSFVIKGEIGRIYPKNDIHNISKTLSDGSVFSDFADYCISLDGSQIYTIREQY